MFSWGLIQCSYPSAEFGCLLISTQIWMKPCLKKFTVCDPIIILKLSHLTIWIQWLVEIYPLYFADPVIGYSGSLDWLKSKSPVQTKRLVKMYLPHCMDQMIGWHLGHPMLPYSITDECGRSLTCKHYYQHDAWPLPSILVIYGCSVGGAGITFLKTSAMASLF